MNTERLEGEASGAGDTAMVVLVGMVVLALFAGIFLWFFTGATVTTAPQPAIPSQQKAAETPFGDDDEPTPATKAAPMPSSDGMPKK